MTKLTLTNLVNLQNETSVVNAINANNVAIENALENTLSRNGIPPNQMGSSLDMNSNQIINLPAPGNLTSPLRLQDVVTGISGITAATGTSGHTVPFLDGNNTWSGTNKYTGNAYFSTGRPWADVRAYGAVGDQVTDDTAACQAAIAAITAIGGGIVYFPPGIYLVTGTLTLSGNIRVIGAGRTASYVAGWHSDITVFNITGSGQNSLEHICVFGKGTNNDTGVFGATQSTVIMSSSGGYIRDCTIWGGSIPLNVPGTDILIDNVDVSCAYGQANVFTEGSNWYYHCKFDMTGSMTTVLPVVNPPYPNWLALHAYTLGQVVLTGGYAIVCTVAGTSGAVAPTLKNIGINITDGGATWLLLGSASLNGIQFFGPGSGENHLFQVDLSGYAYNASMVIQQSGVPGVVVADNCVFSSGVAIQNGTWACLTNCELGGAVNVANTFTGRTTVNGCSSVGASTPINIAANTSNFIITGNHLSGGAITIQPGTSDHYVISNNAATTVVDGGGGVNKSITGNVA